MSNFNKWNRDENFDSDKLNVVLFVSRNKDNKHLENFSERRNAFTTTRDFEDVKHQFQAFVEAGQPGEFARMYTSVNPRSNSKTFKALQHKMLDNEFNLSSLPQRVAALAAKKENAYNDKQNWLFNFDPVEGQDTEKLVYKFVEDLLLAHENTQTKKDQKRPQMSVKLHKTPNGYGVVVDQRFDTRQLLQDYPNVELKRDDLLCYAWDTKK